jgi:hypothetical protein
MSRILLVGATVFLATACVAIIDNSGMVNDDGGGASGSGTNVTVGTTTSTTTSTGSTSTGNFTTGGSPTGAGGSAFGSSSSTGSIGTGGDPTGGTGGTFGGSGGSLPDAGMGGRGGTGGGIVDAGKDTTVGGATFTQVKAIVQQRCVSCHAGFNTYNTLMTHSVSRCGGDKLAVPNDPANSAFLELVLGQNCGGFLMPRGCSSSPCLSASDIQTFQSWISAGAPNN